VSGIALGGGCELMLHSAKRWWRWKATSASSKWAWAGAGRRWPQGSRDRAAKAAQAAGSTNYLNFVTNRFQAAAMAKVSSSALDAQKIGYVQPTDTIVYNVHELLYVAQKCARWPTPAIARRCRAS
jgi:3-hydroxyacyl-CoA dehydrogenase